LLKLGELPAVSRNCRNFKNLVSLEVPAVYGRRGNSYMVVMMNLELRSLILNRLWGSINHKAFYIKYFFFSQRLTLTRLIKAGTSTNGPMTAAKAWPELMPKTATATAIASSKLLLAAVKDNVAD